MRASFAREVSWKRNILLAALCLLVMVACRGVVSSGDGGGDGNLSLWIADAPATGVDSVDITITGVSFQRADVDDLEVTLDRPLEVDLLDLIEEPDMREEILDISLPEGDYDSLTLLLDETRLFVDVEGDRHLMTIPDDEMDGLQVEFNVNVDNDTDLDLTIDFDARKSLRYRGDNAYELHPVLRIVRTERSGTLTGTVDESLIRDSDCENGVNHDEGNTVYIFSGSAPFQDLRGDSGDPVSTALVQRETSGQWEFTAPFLPRGRYNAVFTCDGSVDDPELDNEVSMLFSEVIEFDITAEESTTIDFEGF
ncbi:DUF4382 domain-containing protein [Gilvimarinus sp. F26214L]|uniref:DUF4382 domain-containing protein n=1 Tax=Gilvimarinus sp. DZF01 TaxID=3461371 RepID=UPI0040459F2A